MSFTAITTTDRSRKRRRKQSASTDILRLESPANHRNTDNDDNDTSFNISTEAILDGIVNITALSRTDDVASRGRPKSTPSHSEERLLFSELGNEQGDDMQDPDTIMETGEEQSTTRQPGHDDVYGETETLEQMRASLLAQVRSMEEQVSMLETMVERGKRFNTHQREQWGGDPNDMVNRLLRDNDRAVRETLNQVEVLSPQDRRLQNSVYPQTQNPQTIPRLQLFTGLEMTPVSTRAAMYNGDTVITRHVVKAKSLRNKGNFTFTLIIDVESDGSIVEFKIANLSTWAEPEVRSLIARTTSGENLSLVECLYGLSGYAKISWQRSIAFARLASEFPDLLVGKTSENATIERDPSSWVGDNFASFSKNDTTILLTWKIEFDPITGEPESVVNLLPSYSSKLLSLDDDGTLNYTGQAFTDLVTLRGVYLGAYAILQAVFGDPA